MRDVVVIDFWKQLCRNWCFVVYKCSHQQKLGLKTYVDILAGRTQARNAIYVQWRISIRSVMCFVKVTWDGWYISSLSVKKY